MGLVHRNNSSKKVKPLKEKEVVLKAQKGELEASNRIRRHFQRKTSRVSIQTQSKVTNRKNKLQ